LKEIEGGKEDITGSLCHITPIFFIFFPFYLFNQEMSAKTDENN